MSVREREGERNKVYANLWSYIIVIVDNAYIIHVKNIIYVCMYMAIHF